MGSCGGLKRHVARGGDMWHCCLFPDGGVMKTADRGGASSEWGICLIFISSKMIFLAVIAGEISIQTIDDYAFMG